MGRWRIEACQRDHTVWLFAMPMSSAGGTLGSNTHGCTRCCRGQQTQARRSNRPDDRSGGEVNVLPGESVEAGDVLIVLEAMNGALSPCCMGRTVSGVVQQGEPG